MREHNLKAALECTSVWVQTLDGDTPEEIEREVRLGLTERQTN
jgi:hypothetical protein